MTTLSKYIVENLIENSKKLDGLGQHDQITRLDSIEALVKLARAEVGY